MSEGSPVVGAETASGAALEVRVGVNRLEEVDEPSHLEWERHNARRAALELAFPANGEFVVSDWGDTKDEKETHEFVSLTVLATSVEVHELAWEGLKWISHELATHAVSEVVSAAIGGLIVKLLPWQRERKIARFVVNAGETQVSISPPEEGGDLRLWLPDGTYLEWDQTSDGTDRRSDGG